MSEPAHQPISRRHALGLGGAAAGLVAAGSFGVRTAAAATTSTATSTATAMPAAADTLPVKRIEEILQAQGTVSDGVLTIEIDRDDLHVTGPGGIPFKPAFEINGSFSFQSLGKNRAITNSDFAFLPEELNPAIDAMLAHGLVLQAEHQHFYDLRPMVFFMHFRAVGDPIRLARALAAVVKVTGTPLPQKLPAHPTTPLDVGAIARILGGPATVGADGVVSVGVPRRDTIVPCRAGPAGAERADHGRLPAARWRPARGGRSRLRPARRRGGPGRPADAPAGFRHPLPVQPGDRRAASAVLLPPAGSR